MNVPECRNGDGDNGARYVLVPGAGAVRHSQSLSVAEREGDLVEGT
ncbi:hypothetical protein [Lentzea flaviverrucosa]|uniref:Uncharacterized protein n=1 Tax=Lentzea flaviverrucosa TaxID=200379 RepID=A0A1H9XTG7_9PSEU|nr:hypothetical protein [Lentzea flaviverrucosa]RDI19344.1 hypothetical protein DFR72_117186 [Lentzea flaviverrucosa]SES48983.1 hypothetical protein SAMN05216195_11731 [Lentzea flaviverrucosa]